MQWEENLLEDDMPPEWMWGMPDDLEEWFDEVSARYREGRTRDDDESMVENELARDRR
jgi:hypothetical protein